MRRRTLLVVLAVAVIGAAVAAFVLTRREKDDPGSQAARFLAAWEDADYDALVGLTDADGLDGGVADAVAAHRQMDDALGIEDRTLRATEVSEDGNTAVVAFTAEQTVAGLGRWSYQGALPLQRVDGEWRVRWTHSVLHPDSPPAAEFGLRRNWPERAPIVGADGQPLAAQSEVVTVGVQPNRIGDQALVASALEQHVGVAAAELDLALGQPWVQPEHFVPVVDLRPERFAEVRSVLAPISGVLFQRKTGRLSPTDEFAGHTLGAVGEVTAERLEQLGEPYRAGDLVGLSGLEAAFEEQLAGKPMAEVVVDAEGGDPVVLHTFEGVAPEPVRTTLDIDIQQAADRALASVTTPAALVAVEVSTGSIRAVSSRPLGEAFNRALSGRYPPGSTFKVVTSAALLGSGVTPDDVVDCPEEVVVGGKRFRNFEGESLGATPFREAFVHSCNTAFVQLAADLGEGPLADAARAFGFGEADDPDLPIGATGGRFPEVDDAAELAAAAIGQGRVTASPLRLATMAAAVGAGSWRPARLLGDDATAALDPGRPLPPGVAAALQALMQAVVAEGTGTAAATPGPPVLGKTGTAEFGQGDPLPTHALFVGLRGDIAIAVVIEGGGVGGRVAAPVAAQFFAAL